MRVINCNYYRYYFFILFFQKILGCYGNCTSATEQRERVCLKNSDCLLMPIYPCYNENACEMCTGNCSGKWDQSAVDTCSAFCDGGTQSVQFTCKDQSKTNERIVFSFHCKARNLLEDLIKLGEVLKSNLLLYFPYYAEACYELAGPFSASLRPGSQLLSRKYRCGGELLATLCPT